MSSGRELPAKIYISMGTVRLYGTCLVRWVPGCGNGTAITEVFYVDNFTSVGQVAQSV
jgi:hypothetical protein